MATIADVHSLSPPEAARPPEALTTRGLVVGAVAAAALGLGCAYGTMVLRGSYMDLDFSTPGALFILFVLVAFGRGLLKKIAPALALTPAELTSAYVMLLMASAVPTMGLTGQIVPLISAPYYFMTAENKWEQLLLPHLARWSGPHDPEVVRGLFEGWARGAAVPWGAWLPPLLAWLPFIVALHFGMICLMVIFRRQWVEHERLPYPVTQLPLAMASGYDSGSPRPFFRQATTWIGFAIPFIYASLIGLHYYLPGVPAPQVAWAFPMFRRHNTLSLRISFPMLGFFYLVPLDTLFSLWSLNLIFFCIRGVLNVVGLDLHESLGVFGTPSPLFAHLGMGAMLALVVTGLRVGRHHLRDVWVKAWRSAPEVDDSEEIMSYRTAVFGLLAATLILVVWLNWSGLPFWLTLPFLLLAFTLFFGLTRIVAEMGVAEAVAAAIAPSMTTSIFGCGLVGPRGLAALGLAHVWCSDIRTFVMASTANSLKLATVVKLRGPRLLLGMLVAIGLAALSSMWLTVRQAYQEGGLVLNNWFFDGGPTSIWRWVAEKMANPTGPHLGGMATTAGGAAAYLLFTFLRQRFAWWPFHPIALAIAPVWIMDQLWLMCFCAWLFKLLALRYGGLKTYGALRSFFLGLILGQFVANGLWLFVDHFAGTRGNQIFWICVPHLAEAMMALLLLATALFGGGAVAMADPTPDALPPRPFAPDLRAFCGVNYVAPPEVMRTLGLGWGRESFPIDWGAVEPERGRWNWEKFDRVVLDAHAQGVEVLPMLGYTAPWAATADGGFGPARDVADWEEYVEQVVARYSRPPFSLRYYQVWNEPTWTPLTFWKRTGPEWIDTVFLPAARIVRRYGCQVVFGGWPVADAGHLFEALEYHEAWRWTDIVDVHYFGIDVWQAIYDRYLKDGKCRGAWQTELGFHPFPEYIANLYPRAMRWALTHGWTEDPDKYKLLWFASWGAGPDGPNCLTMPGEQGNNTLTAHGLRARTLAQVFGDGQLAAFDGFSTAPALPVALDEERRTALGFRVGSRVVVTLILDAETLKATPTVEITIPKLAAKPAAVRLISSAGEARTLSFDFGEGTLRCRVPMDRLPCAVARNWGHEWRVAVGYVVIAP